MTDSLSWKETKSIIRCISKHFQFMPRIIVCDLEKSLIDKITHNKFYNKLNKFEIKPYDEEFITKLQKDSKDKSIVVISNQFNSNKLNIDLIKAKVNFITETLKLNIIGLFSLKQNFLSKPYHNIINLLKFIYHKHGSSFNDINIVSDYGGLLIEKKDVFFVDTSDIDRAFAININNHYKETNQPITCDYQTVYEYLDDTVNVKFEWARNTMPPEMRLAYIDEHNILHRNAYQSAAFNIFNILPHFNHSFRLSTKFGTEIPSNVGIGSATSMGNVNNLSNSPIITYDQLQSKSINNLNNCAPDRPDSYVLFILGPPRCGKTTLIREIQSQWNAHPYSKKNQLIYLTNKTKLVKVVNEFKKLITERFNIIIEGYGATEAERANFMQYIQPLNHRIATVYIEVLIGNHLSILFNHIYIENSRDEEEELYESREYNIYKSRYQRPNGCVIYNPKIKVSNSLLFNRY